MGISTFAVFPGILVALAATSVAARPAGTMGSGLDARDAPADSFAVQLDPFAATTCPAGTTLPGIDVSKWQGDIDWNAVADAGIVYAIVRATHGINTIDEWFDSNWNDSRAAGIYAGVYQYFEPGQDPIAQADIMLEMMGALGAEDLPPVIDVESHGDLPPAEVANAVGQWITHVEAATGVKPIIYTGRYFWQDYVQSPAFADYPLWIAHYTDGCPNIPDQWTDWRFHQYTSTGTVAGVAGDVDRNDFNGDLAALSGLFAAPAQCGDAVCSGDENPDVCAEDCPPCGTIAAAGSDIDDGDACLGFAGPPEYWRQVAEGEQGDSVWTAVTAFDAPSNFAVASLHFAEAGRYSIDAHLVGAYAQSKLARYAVTHGEGTSDVVIDQALQTESGSGWVSLGEFQFVVGSAGQQIRIDDNTGENAGGEVRISIDAFRLTRLDAPDGMGEPTTSGGDDDPDPTSDSEGPSGTSDGEPTQGGDDDDDGSDSDSGNLPPFADGDDADGCGCTNDRDRSGLALVVLAFAFRSGVRAAARRRQVSPSMLSDH